jgi:cytochrome P450
MLRDFEDHKQHHRTATWHKWLLKWSAFDMASAMPLTEMVFHEALRLVPPVPQVPRVALKDF